MSQQHSHREGLHPAKTQRRLRILLIAERANPEYTSIPLHGWSHSRAIANYADVHIVTQHWNGPAFARAGFTDFTGINTSVVHEPMKRLIALLRGGEGRGWTTDTALSSVAYYYFEWLVWRRFKQRIQAKEFDIVHRILPSSPTAASLIAAKCKQAGVPFVLGPINGGLPWPAQFANIRHQEGEWLSYIRGLYRLMPGYRTTRENATAIITASKATQRLVSSRYQNKCVYVPENGVDIARFSRVRSHRASSSPLKVIFVGRLVPYKGADMLIAAAAPLLKANKLTLEIVGDGPERMKLAQQIRECGLMNAVSLVGSVPQAQLPEKLAQSDIFAFPSIREFGGAVVVEAMVTGLACIVVDYGGPGEIVSESTGYKVPLASREEIVENVRSVLQSLVEKPEKIECIGEKARRRIVEKFTWDAKARRTLSVYEWVLARAPRPDPSFYEEDSCSIEDKPYARLQPHLVSSEFRKNYA